MLMVLVLVNGLSKKLCPFPPAGFLSSAVSRRRRENCPIAITDSH
jgi:hypothetical protein